MFTKHARKSSLEFAKSFLTLSENDNTLLKEIITWIKEHDMAKQAWISQIGPEQMLKLAEQDKTVEKFCKHDDFAHAGVWSDALKKGGDLYFENVALGDDGEVFKIYDLYVGNYINLQLYQELDKPLAEQDHNAILFWMAEGCKYNSFYALRESCKYEIEKILANESNDATFEFANHLVKNLELVSKLYMTNGYLYAATAYYKLAKGFDLNEAPDLAMGYYEKALEALLYSRAVEKREIPEDVLIRQITKPEMDKIIGGLGFKSLEEAEAALLKKISPARLNHIEQYKQALSKNIDYDIADRKDRKTSFPTSIRPIT